MEPFLIANGALSLAAAIAMSAVVLCRSVDDGLIIKGGLILMIFALLASAVLSFADMESMRALQNAGLILRIGLVTVCVGLVLRRWPLCEHPLRRLFRMHGEH